ncbi:MAG TPA: hypothetical protein EYQ81_16130, partial [Sneathiellales bacterium]|nr:hypothetical protein [Sneathiellales bacterium]
MQLGSMVAGGLSTGGGFGTQAILLLLTILFWLLMSFAVFSVVSEFGDALHWMAGPAVISAVGLASALPAPPAGVGVYEGAAVFALTAFDMDGGIALSDNGWHAISYAKSASFEESAEYRDAEVHAAQYDS